MHDVLSSNFTTTLTVIGGFESTPTLAIAVSGGPDSMALLLLAQRWATEHGGRAIALTVDHQLRPESKAEAQQVAAWCSARNIEHHTLTWQSADAHTQDAAREARYHLLTQWCRDHHAAHLLTAHHQGDQAETLFFRLARGSQLDGLACIPILSQRHGIRLIRPLLGASKSELVNFLGQENQGYIDDPSNRSPSYTRNHIRALIAESGNAKEIGERAFQVCETLGRFRAQLEQRTEEKMSACVTFLPDGSAAIGASSFVQLEPEYGLRILASLARRIGGGEHKPRTEKLERFYLQLGEDIHMRSAKRRTFANCIFQPRAKQGIILVKAEG